MAGGKGEDAAPVASHVAPIEMHFVDAAGEPIESDQPSLPDAAQHRVTFETALPHAVRMVPEVCAASYRPPPSDIEITWIGAPPPMPFLFVTHPLIVFAITEPYAFGNTTSV